MNRTLAAFSTIAIISAYMSPMQVLAAQQGMMPVLSKAILAPESPSFDIPVYQSPAYESPVYESTPISTILNNCDSLKTAYENAVKSFDQANADAAAAQNDHNVTAGAVNQLNSQIDTAKNDIKTTEKEITKTKKQKNPSPELLRALDARLEAQKTKLAGLEEKLPAAQAAAKKTLAALNVAKAALAIANKNRDEAKKKYEDCTNTKQQ